MTNNYTANSELVTFGGTSPNAVTFRGARLTPNTFQQAYQGFRTGPGADRSSLTDLTKLKFSDFSGGLDPTPGIKSWLRDLNKFSYNEGLQTRLPGLCILPFDLLNQAGITSDEDVSTAVASGWRAHAVMTSLGDTESRFYVGVGHKVFRNVGNGNSALEVCYTTTNVITSMAVLNVNQTPRLCVATNGDTDDVFYVADPTGTWSGNTTVLVALSSGDWITAMQYFPTLGSGANIMVGMVGGVNGVWWKDITTAAAWTMEPVVTNASKNNLGNIASVTLSNLDPTASGQTGQGTTVAPIDDGSTRVGSGRWQDTDNALASDNARATYPLRGKIDTGGSTANEQYGWRSSTLVVSGFPTTSIPKAGKFVGAQLTVERNVSSTSISAGIDVVLTINGSAGEPRSGDQSTSTSDITDTLGATGDDWGLNVAGVESIAVEIVAGGTKDGDSADNTTVGIDHVRITSFVYQILGDMVSFALGGWGVSPNPAFPERLAIVVPATKNDIGAIHEPRVLWFLDFQWESSQERPVMVYSRPNTGLAYTHHAVPFQGGWAVTGNNSDGAGVSLKHVDSSGNLRDFAFPAHNGLEEYRVSSMFTQGSWLVLDCVAQDNGDRQWWFYNNARYFPDTILQSLSDGLDIAAQPIPYSTVGIDLENDIIYSLFPHGSDIGVARQFLPPDLGLDPRIVLASQVKTQASRSTAEDSPLRLQTVELDIGPEEANKAIVVLEYLGRRISAGTGAAYGSVHVDVVTDNDATFATPEITTEFETAFGLYNVPNAGVTFRSVRFRIGLEHDPNTAETPDGVPVLLTSVQDWPHERVYVFELRELITPDNIFAFMDQLEALCDTRETGKVVQPLDMANIPNQPAKFDRYLIPNEGLVLPPRSVQPAPAHFIDARGNEVFIGLMFHTTPGTGAT